MLKFKRYIKVKMSYVIKEELKKKTYLELLDNYPKKWR